MALEIPLCWQGKEACLRGYPDVTLKMAREKRDTARQQLGAGIDPGEARKAEKIAQAGTESFEAVAREWYGKFSPGWAANHADRILRRLENDLFGHSTCQRRRLSFTTGNGH